MFRKPELAVTMSKLESGGLRRNAEPTAIPQHLLGVNRPRVQRASDFRGNHEPPPALLDAQRTRNRQDRNVALPQALDDRFPTK